MSSREQVFRNVREALAAIPAEQRAPYPEWDDSLAVCRAHSAYPNLWSLFSVRCKGVNGIALDDLSALADFLRSLGLETGYCDPALLPVVRRVLPEERVKLETRFDRTRIDSYQFGITRAAAVIAETGSIVLCEESTSSRLGALAPWVHIALVPRDAVLPDVPTALRRFGRDPNIIFVTGPSKTADIEGILIEGVHGPGVQACCLLPAG